jgi:hypothetical protein
VLLLHYLASCRTISAIASGGILFALFSAPFWFAGYQLAGQAFAGALMHERFAIGRNKWRIAQVRFLISSSWYQCPLAWMAIA